MYTEAARILAEAIRLVAKAIIVAALLKYDSEEPWYATQARRLLE